MKEREVRINRMNLKRDQTQVSDLINFSGGELDAGQTAPVDRPRVDADLVFLDERFVEGGVAEDDRLAEIALRVDEFAADPEEVVRRLLSEKAPRPEAGVDE